MTKFTCMAYPFLRVLIERSGNKVGGDRFAEFRFGNYETDNEKEIGILCATPFVYADKNLHLENMTIAIEDDQNLIAIANLTASGATVVTPTATRHGLTRAEREGLKK